VQEALTNARKHAPDTTVDVLLRGRPGQELLVEVRNPVRVGAVTGATPGSGLGLVGLSERAQLVGGLLEHGMRDGDFVVSARLAVAGMSAVRVVIVDDDALVRAGLAMILGGDDSLDVVGEAGDGLAGLELVARTRPDVVLMDIRMPRLDGLGATARLMEQPDPPKVLVLTTFDARRARGAGAERRRQRVPAQGHAARRDRGGDPPGGGRRPHALPQCHGPADRPARRGRARGRSAHAGAGPAADPDLAGARGSRSRSPRASPTPTSRPSCT
jgi:CheY-like chemotaxis protein